jgi:hypothetical protein
MAVNSNDITFTIIPETVLGTTPTTGTDRHALPIKEGTAVPIYKANEIVSDTLKPNRTGAGSRRGISSGEGTLDFRFQKCPAIDLLLSSALSGTWNAGVLQAGKADSSFSIVSALASDMFRTSGGAIVSSFKIDGTAGAGVNSSFDFVFTKRADSSTNNALAVTAVPATSIEYEGSEVSVTVAGQTLDFVEFSVEVTQDRVMRNILGSTTPKGVGTSGIRSVKFTAKAFRESFAIDTLINGTPQPIVITIGEEDNGYKITIPAGYGMVPTDETAESMMVVLEFTAGHDIVSGTDIIIEAL